VTRAGVGQQAPSKADQKTKAKNEEFDVPFGLVVANGFGRYGLQIAA